MDPQSLVGPVSTRAHVISNFDAFILHNVPYGEVRQRDIQWGAVQYDGPDAPGITGAKPVMYWHFGGVPSPISKAVRILYTFVQFWDGSNETITASILLGFHDRLSD